MKHNDNGMGPGLLAVALVAVSLTLGGCLEQSASQLVDSGKGRMQKREYKAAAIEFKNALQKDGSLLEARFLLGKALLESGDPRGAWVELSKVREVGYNNDELVPVMVACLLLGGQVDKFIAEYADVQLSDPKRHAELKAALATAYGSKGKYAQARAAADAALQADPSNIVAQLAVARLLLIAEDRVGALAQIDRTIAEHPEAAQPWVSKAEVLHASGRDPTAAMTAYREALRRQPDHLDAHLGVVGILWQQRDFDGVDKQLAAINKLQPNSVHVRYYSALLALERKSLKVAREVSQDLLKMAPDNPRFLQLAGMVEYERGGYVAAIAHLSKALPTTSTPIAVRVLLARSQLRAGDPRKALAAVQPLLSTEQQVPSDVFSVAADAYLQVGDERAARRMTELAVKANPDDVRGRTALAVAQLGEGRTEHALTALRSISASDVSVEPDVVLFTAHMRSDRLADALAVLDAIDRKQPDKPTGPFLRAQLELRQQRKDKARASFELALKRSPGYIPAAAALAAMDQEAGKPGVAVARFETLVKVIPDSVDAHMALNFAKIKAGVPFDEVRAQFESLVKRFPESDQPRLALVRQMVDKQDFKAALQGATEGAARFPNQSDFLDLMGLAELALGNFNQASQAFNKLAAMQPNAVEPLMRLVDVQLARKDVSAAVYQLRKVLSIKPDHVPAHAVLIMLLQRTGKSDEALTQAKSLQAQAKDDPTGWTYEGEILAARRNFPAALAAYRTSQSKRSTSETATKLHRALVDSAQNAEAAKYETEWMAKHPDDPVFNFYLGDLALGREEFDKAEDRYRKVLAVKPNDPITLNNLAWLLHRAGKPGGLEIIERAMMIAPKSPALMDTAAEIHAAAGRYDKALALQGRALEIDPNQPVHRLHLAQYLIKLGRKSEAQAELDKLSQLGSSFNLQGQVQKLRASLGI